MKSRRQLRSLSISLLLAVVLAAGCVPAVPASEQVAAQTAVAGAPTAMPTLALTAAPTVDPDRRSATATTAATPATAPVAAADPKALAESVLAASSPDAQYDALLGVMRALKVGVYEAETGKAIVTGLERGPRDVYLYDFEVRAIANALRAKRTWDLAYVAGFYTRAGLSDSTAPMDPAALQNALTEAARDSAQTPDDPQSLVPLLIRELGLRHERPYDLLQPVAPSDLHFDALQVFLVEADTLIPASRETAVLAKPGPRLVALSIPRGLTAGSLQGEGLCGGMDALKGITPFGKVFLMLIKALKKAAAVPEIIHGEILAYSVDVRAVSKAQETHFGHDSDGKQMRFEIKVEMLEDYGNIIVKCGALAGFEVPKKGGIPDVPMLWESGGLEQLGTVTYDPPSKKTNASGVSALVFTPNKEKRPNQGPVVEEKGAVQAVALYQSAFKNWPGSAAQFLTPKSDVIAWTVARHRNLSLQIKMEGSANLGDGTVKYGPDEVLIPLQTQGGTYQGTYKGDFHAKVTSECSGDATYPVEFKITANGIDPLDFSVVTSIGMSIALVCDGGGGGAKRAPVTGKPLTFSLPAKDGASWSDTRTFTGGSIAITYTLKEQ